MVRSFQRERKREFQRNGITFHLHRCLHTEKWSIGDRSVSAGHVLRL